MVSSYTAFAKTVSLILIIGVGFWKVAQGEIQNFMPDEFWRFKGYFFMFFDELFFSEDRRRTFQSSVWRATVASGRSQDGLTLCS